MVGGRGGRKERRETVGRSRARSMSMHCHTHTHLTASLSQSQDRGTERLRLRDVRKPAHWTDLNPSLSDTTHQPFPISLHFQRTETDQVILSSKLIFTMALHKTSQNLGFIPYCSISDFYQFKLWQHN